MKNFCIISMESGKVKNVKPLAKVLSELKDGRYTVEVSRLNKRTNPQNRYLHGVLITEFRKALNSVGYNEVKTDAQAKLIMKSMFLKRQIVNQDTGEVIEYIQDTSDCTKEEITILIEEVVQFCAENCNYIIPLPNEQVMMNYE